MLVGCNQQASLVRKQSTPTKTVLAANQIKVKPLSIYQYRTTNGDIYLGNLNSRIQSLEQLAIQHHSHRLLLASSLFHRFRVAGRLSDLSNAQLHLSSYLKQARSQQQQRDTALILQASLFSAMHQFEQALEALQQLSNQANQAIPVLRAEILLAKGLYQQAETMIESLSAQTTSTKNLQQLSLQANLAIEQGHLTQGLQLFDQAQRQYRKTNPLLLSWIQTQMGIALLRNRYLTEARTFFQTARQRLPVYYLATEHLAETELKLGNLPNAETVYIEVSQQTGNPEYYAMLAKTQKRLGKLDASTKNQQFAKQGYLELLRQHPQAYAQHAAVFFFDTGDFDKALELAKLNVQNRQDVHSWLLLSRVYKAMQQKTQACAALSKANRSGIHPPELMTANASSQCVRM